MSIDLRDEILAIARIGVEQAKASKEMYADEIERLKDQLRIEKAKNNMAAFAIADLRAQIQLLKLGILPAESTGDSG